MSSATIFYFSGTGNTWWLAHRLSDMLGERGIDVRLLNIEDDPSVEDIANSDIVGLGFPIYGSDCPPNMTKFIEKLPEVTDKDCFIFTSMLIFSGDGALTTERILIDKGYRLNQAVNFIMMNNVRLPYPVLSSFPIYNETQAAKIRGKAAKKLVKFADSVHEGKKWIEGRGILGKIGGLSQRIPMSYIGWTGWCKNYNLDKEACIECMQCVKYCPTNNITFTEGEMQWHDSCVCCLRCYNLCPTEAIQYKEATRDTAKFPRFKGPFPGFKISDMLGPRD